MQDWLYRPRDLELRFHTSHRPQIFGFFVGCFTDVAWNWQFRFPLEKVFAWIREWGSILNIERGRDAAWKGGVTTCGMFSQFITLFKCAILGKHGLQDVSAGKHCNSSLIILSLTLQVIRDP